MVVVVGLTDVLELFGTPPIPWFIDDELTVPVVLHESVVLSPITIVELLEFIWTDGCWYTVTVVPADVVLLGPFPVALIVYVWLLYGLVLNDPLVYPFWLVDTPPYPLIPVSYTHLTLPTKRIV